MTINHNLNNLPPGTAHPRQQPIHNNSLNLHLLLILRRKVTHQLLPKKIIPYQIEYEPFPLLFVDEQLADGITLMLFEFAAA